MMDNTVHLLLLIQTTGVGRLALMQIRKVPKAGRHKQGKQA